MDLVFGYNGFGRGLPPGWDNETAWPLLRPLLADPTLQPTPDDVARAAAMAHGLLRLRRSTRLFRLGSPALATRTRGCPGSGPTHPLPCGGRGRTPTPGLGV